MSIQRRSNVVYQLGSSQYQLHDLKIFSTSIRPNSAPTMKPRPPSARRYNLVGKNDRGRTRTTPGRSFHPHNLNGVEGKRASEKVQSRQHRIIINGKGKERLFRSATLPADFTSSYTHINENNFFPKLKRKSPSGGGGSSSSYLDHNGNISPRVLVWGNNEDENAGKKLVAVGDRVSAKIYSDCSKSWYFFLHGFKLLTKTLWSHSQKCLFS